jgi:hypothetical protein
MSNLTLEQANQLAAKQGTQIVQSGDGQFEVVPLNTPTSVPVPQPSVSMRMSDYSNCGYGHSTSELVSAFREAGRAVNGGVEVNHSL